MSEQNMTRLRVAIITIALLAVVVNIFIFGHPHQEVVISFPRKHKPIPADGLAYNDTNGKIPGDPKQAVAQMHRLYEWLQIYKQRHGEYPMADARQSPDLVSDMFLNPKVYGFAKNREAADALKNPDMAYADSAAESVMANRRDTVPYFFPLYRPDGTTRHTPKQSGGRDVLAQTDMYVHENIRIFRGDRTTMNPLGFHLVLWEDGQVTAVPYDKVRYVKPPSPSGSAPVFDGQAGIGVGNTVSYAEYQNSINGRSAGTVFSAR